MDCSMEDKCFVMRTWLVRDYGMWIQFKFPLVQLEQHVPRNLNTLSGLIQGIWAQASTWRPIDGDERNLQPLTSMIQVQES